LVAHLPSVGPGITTKATSAVGAVGLLGLAGLIFFLAADMLNGGSEPAKREPVSPLPPAVFLQMTGFKRAGASASAKWYAQAEGARTVARKFGPFRFAPLRQYELTTLHVTIELNAGAPSASGAIVETLAKMAASFGVESQVSRLVGEDLHVLVVSSEKRPLGLLTADSATWTGARGAARLQNVRWREPGRVDLYSRAARLDPEHMHLLAESWVESGALMSSNLQGPRL
jgi:hypothetical protein